MLAWFLIFLKKSAIMAYFYSNTLRFSCILFFSFFSFIYAQDNYVSILDSYEDHLSEMREVVYLHLNKSIYIKGESIGFTAYILDKDSKNPSMLTTNLYISLEDENGKLIRQKLLKAQNGVVANVLEMDSSFTSGHYTIKAYTNYMRNFKEQNYFVESIRIIDPEKEKSIISEIMQNEIDAQFLPESGHLINGLVNNIGVVLKDIKGYGIPKAKGTVSDQKNNLITTFEVNKFGIGKFPLLTETGKQYKININYLNKDHEFILNQKIEKIGISLSMVNYRDKAIIKLATNPESLDFIENKSYKLSIHNGSQMDVIDISFDQELEILKVYDLKTIPPGINILTLFNENNQPILERLFFNYNGIELVKSNNLKVKNFKDSIEVKLSFKNIDPNLFHNISVSILPQETQSYKSHHNLLSYTYLQPYIRGNIEQARYYFTDIDEKKRLELDNLLITQGWSSYDWNDIFTSNKTINFEFEQGIKLKANTNGDNSTLESTYMVYTEESNEPFFFEVKNTDVNYFYIDNLFPIESNRIYISKFEKDNIYPTKLYVQAMPSNVPYLQTSKELLRPKDYYSLETNLNSNQLSFESLKNVQQLDEVVLNAELTKKELRIKELQKKTWGDITIIGDQEIKEYMYLSNFLAMNGFYAIEKDKYNMLIVENKPNTKFNPKPPPLLYLDGFRASRGDLYRFSLSDIDYIAIDRMGQIPGKSLGAIRIYSYSGSRKERNREKSQEFTFPLVFSPNKKFYTPKYRYYNDAFYKAFGTVDWRPELVVDSNGIVSFKIEKPEVPITFFIEGITNDGSFIFEEQSISLN